MTDYLANSKGYPWRASLTKKARCAACQFIRSVTCLKGHKVKYPTYANTHNCCDFKFKPNPFDVYKDDFNKIPYNECVECSHNFRNRCSGKRWIPITIIEGKCEFFRPKGLICKNAIPYSQYCNHLRNNYCKLPPHKRDQNERVRFSWSHNCIHAHVKGIESNSCYKPKSPSK